MNIKYATFGMLALMGIMFVGYLAYLADWENMTAENAGAYLILTVMILTLLNWYYKKMRM